MFLFEVILQQPGMSFKDLASEEKQSLSTIPSSAQFCTCAPFLKERLFQILGALQEDIFSKKQELQQIKISYEQNIQEKEEIIERLVSANSMLVVDNQVLTKRVLEERKQFQRRSEIMKARIQEYEVMMEQLQQNWKQVKLRNKYCNILRKRSSESTKKLTVRGQLTPRSPSKRESSQIETLNAPKMVLAASQQNLKFFNKNQMIGTNCQYYGTVRISNRKNQYQREANYGYFEGMMEGSHQ